MDFNSELTKRISPIEQWLEEDKIGATKEKRESIMREMFWIYIDCNMEPSDIDIIKEKLKTTPFNIFEVDLWKTIRDYFDGNDKYVKFFKGIYKLTPTGLNTSPNSCCGKYELLWRLLRPKSTQPTKGDILDNGEKCEIKGETLDGGVRISDTELTGKDYNKNNKEIFEGKVNGNLIKTGGLKNTRAFEIEKPQHKSHYEDEFNKIGLNESKDLISKYFVKNGWNISHEEIEIIFQNGKWNQDIMNKFSLSKMFNKYKQHNGFDKMIIFGDGTNVKIISTCEDLDKIQIQSDYFRINQPAYVGWYIL